jgi:hypothetical protein
VINLQTIQTTIVFSAPLVMPHRLQSRANSENPYKLPPLERGAVFCCADKKGKNFPVEGNVETG